MTKIMKIYPARKEFIPNSRVLVNMLKNHKLTFLRCGSSVGSNIDHENVLTTMARLVIIALVEQSTFVNEIFSAPESTYTENTITKLSDYEKEIRKSQITDKPMARKEN